MKKSTLKKLTVFVLISACFSGSKAVLWAASKTVQTDSKASIRPVLELSVSQQGKGELRFSDVLPSDKKETQVGPVIMNLKVQSNSGERYQVTQNSTGDLENAEGDKIKLENLRFTTASASSLGTPVVNPQSVTQSTQTIFISDPEGKSDNLVATYYLTIPASQEPGDYAANITYTVSSL